MTLRPIHCYFIIAMATLAAYSNSFYAEWHFDDVGLISDDYEIRDLKKAVWNLPFKSRSVVDLSFAINYALGEYFVTGYHIVNVSTHILTAFALFVFIQNIFITPGGREDANAPASLITAFFTSLLFSLHPAHTMAVTYIVQRYTLLAALFYLCTLIFYMKFRLGKERERFCYYGVALIFALLAAHSKPNAFTIPAAILLIEVLFFRSSMRDRKMLIRAVPFAIVAAIIPIRLFLANYFYDPLEEVIELSGPIGVAGGLEGLLAHFHTLLYYIKFTLWPSNLAIVHDFPYLRSLLDPLVISAYAVAGLMVWIAVRVRKTNPVLGFGLLFFLLAPILELYWPDPAIFYDHWLYLASTGLILSGVYLLLLLVETRRASLRVTGTVISIAALLLAIASYERNSLWNTEIGIWFDAVKKSPGNPMAFSNLGARLAMAGQMRAGCIYIEEGYKLDKMDYSLLNNMGNCRRDMGDTEGASRFYKMAESIKPNSAELEINMSKLNPRSSVVSP